ncbi:kinesin-like protein KIN-14N [Impatiens glandulifera]|uniref:kinesin-like protein KIN-14N n=1 Tax=Impatiens glandulifera TaxID=253017 RepID=UPI001FB1568E|nr:kinesin-like protein KIN-14N [Impatiens glandulifera]
MAYNTRSRANPRESTSFTKEEISDLLNKKVEINNKISLKVKCEQRLDYIERLRVALRWYLNKEIRDEKLKVCEELLAEVKLEIPSEEESNEDMRITPETEQRAQTES